MLLDYSYSTDSSSLKVLPLLEVEKTFVALVIIAASNLISYFCRQRLASLTPNSNIDLLVATSWSNIAPVQRLERQNIGGIFEYSFVLYMYVPYLKRHRMIEYSTHYIYLRHPEHPIHTSERSTGVMVQLTTLHRIYMGYKNILQSQSKK